MAYLLNPEEKKYQRRLIPLNIVMAIIALVAAISLLVAPLFEFDASKFLNELIEISTEDGLPSDGSEEGSDDAEEDEDGSEEGSGSKIDVSEIFKKIEVPEGLKLSFSTLTFAKLGFAPKDKQLKTMIDSFIPMDVIADLMITAVNTGVAIGFDIIDKQGFEVANLVKEFRKFDTVKSQDDFDKFIENYTNVLKDYVDVDPADLKDTIHEMLDPMYSKTVEAVGADKFNIESFICVNAVDLINGGKESEEGKEVPVFTTYSDLLVGVLDGTLSTGKDGDSGLSEVMSLILKYFSIVFIAAFAGLAFYSLIWFILFLFAFIKIFTKNKRFLMWYAKLFGATPCLIFGVAPLITKLILGSSAGAAAAAVLGAVSSLTWISGACYLLMWILSICWAFPIKRKIRKIRKGQPV